MESVPVEIPESMLRVELDSRWRNLARRLNTDSNGLFKMMGNSKEQAESVLESWKPDAAKALHSRLVVETMMEELKIEATDDDLENELEKMASENNVSLAEINKYYEDKRMRELLQEAVRERKFFDLFLENNTLKTGKKGNYIDLMANNG